MAVTISTDVHKIQQIGSNAVDIAFQATPLLAIPGLVENVSGRISDAGGDSISFTVWETDISGITQDAVRNSRTGVTPSKLSLSSYTENAITKTISIDGDRFALSDSSESAMEHISAIVGKEFSRVIQANLVTQAVDETNGTDLELDVSATGKMTVKAILDARLQWADRASELGQPTLLMHTKQFTDLATDADFKSMVQGGSVTPAVPRSDWSRFVVAEVYGCNIVLLDTLPYVDATTDTYTALMVAPGAFGVFVADNPQTVMVDHAGSTVQTIDTHFRYASTLFRHNPRRVVKLITQ